MNLRLWKVQAGESTANPTEGTVRGRLQWGLSIGLSTSWNQG